MFCLFFSPIRILSLSEWRFTQRERKERLFSCTFVFLFLKIRIRRRLCPFFMFFVHNTNTISNHEYYIKSRTHSKSSFEIEKFSVLINSFFFFLLAYFILLFSFSWGEDSFLRNRKD